MMFKAQPKRQLNSQSMLAYAYNIIYFLLHCPALAILVGTFSEGPLK